MKINLAASREKFLSTGRSYTKFARVEGLNPSAFMNFMLGRQVPAPGGEAEARYFKALKNIGVLVLEDDRRVQQERRAEQGDAA